MPESQPAITESSILKAALKILRKEGWGGISARAIAKKLKCSTMPIYSHFTSMKKLESSLKEESVHKLIEYQLKPYTDNPFLNLSIGYVHFAREEKGLFRFLFIERPAALSKTQLNRLLKRDIVSRLHELLGVTDMDQSPINKYFSSFDGDEIAKIAKHALIYTHGLAVLVSGGMMKSLNDKEITDLLLWSGDAFYRQMERELSQQDPGENE